MAIFHGYTILKVKESEDIYNLKRDFYVVYNSLENLLENAYIENSDMQIYIVDLFDEELSDRKLSHSINFLEKVHMNCHVDFPTMVRFGITKSENVTVKDNLAMLFPEEVKTLNTGRARNQHSFLFSEEKYKSGQDIKLNTLVTGFKTLDDLAKGTLRRKPTSYHIYEVTPYDAKYETRGSLTTAHFNNFEVIDEIEKKDFLYNNGELFHPITSNWLLIDQLNFFKEISEYAEHPNYDNISEVVLTSDCLNILRDNEYAEDVKEVAARCLYVSEMDMLEQIEILGMSDKIRTAFISENIEENFYEEILKMLLHDENEFIRKMAKKALNKRK